jgi:hypothetical protein
MTHFVLKTDHHTPAPLRGARCLLTIALVACAAIVLALVVDLRLRAPDRDNAARAWMQALNLSAPALWPAGTVLRHPEMMHAGVDLRFAPGLADEP